jgi:sialate O-acetylesterase
MVITDGQTTRVLTNILVGDVWVCSGQSNMEWPLSATDNPQQAVSSARYDEIRLFEVTKNANVNWQGDVVGEWKICTPDSAREFSAVGYYFGRSIHLSQNTPVGLIDTTWGGTPAEAWTPSDALAAMPQTKELWNSYVAGLEALKSQNPEIQEAVRIRSQGPIPDKGNKGEAEGWHKPGSAGWTKCSIPNAFSSIPGLNINGTVWFRRSFTVPASLAGQAATLSLGPIDDWDITYLNGEKTGATGAETPNFWMHPRRYAIPAGRLKAGENFIAVRVHDSGGAGGLTGGQQDLFIQAGSQKIPLSGAWEYKVEYRVLNLGSMAGPFNQNSPSALWAGMVKPLVPFGIKGAIWYQGESNVGRSDQYAALFPGMIRAWRRAWGLGEFPFLHVQLANFLERKKEPGDSQWALLREAQEAALKLNNTGSAVIIDIGDAEDIHPRNKKDVGERLAMSARTFAYKGEPAGNSPRLRSWRTLGSTAIVTLTDSAGLRTTNGRPPIGFAVRGAEGPWFWAEAIIQGTDVVLSHPSVPLVKAVRYAWADNPEVNLVNGLDLPVSPFRTDR